MPQIMNNKGFGVIPILVLSLVLGLVALAGYKMLGQDKVLPESTQYAQVNFPTTVPSNLIKIRLGYTETSGFKNGKITLRISLNNDKVGALGELNAYIKKYGLVVEDYCMAAVCPRPRIVKPNLTFVERPTEMYLQGEIPVTSLVKSVSLSNPVNIDPKVPPFSFENNLVEWDLRLSDGNRKFSIIRKSEKTIVGITLISKLPNGQETYQVYINGVGDDSAELIRTIRTTGIKRMDLVGSNLRTTVVKPAVTYANGQGKFNVTALNNTRTFYVTPSRKLNIDISSIPAGWVKNKNGDGFDRLEQDIKPVISVMETPINGSTDRNFNFVMKASKGNMDLILNVLNSEGVQVSRFFGDNSDYPNQKPTVVCGEYTTAGCRFSVKVPAEAKYVNVGKGGSLLYFKQPFSQLPKNWYSSTNGVSIYRGN